MVVTDRGDVVLLGIKNVANPGVRPGFYHAAVWRPGEMSWKELPRSEVVGYDPVWWWSEGRVVNASGEQIDGGEVNNYGRSFPSGGLLDPYERTWMALPDRPPTSLGVTRNLAAAGDGAVVAGGWALDVAGSTWSEVPPDRDLAEQEPAVAVVEAHLFAWGGARFPGSQPVRADVSAPRLRMSSTHVIVAQQGLSPGTWCVKRSPCDPVVAG